MNAPDAPRPYTLVETAEALALHAMREEFLFALTGSWAGNGEVDACRGFFSEQSAFHAWRREQWIERMPRSVSADPEVLRRAEESLQVQFGASEPDDVIRLVTWSAILMPALAQSYLRHADRLAVPADAGLERMLGIVTHDVGTCTHRGAELAGNILAARAGCTDGTDEFSELAAAQKQRLGTPEW